MRTLFIMIVTALVGIPGMAQASSALLSDVAVTADHVAAVKNKPFTLIAGTKKIQIPASDVSAWFKTRSSGDSLLLQLRPNAVYDSLNVRVSPKVNDVGEKSRFTSHNKKITLVHQGRKGTIVDGVKTSLAIRSALVAGKNSATVALKEYRPFPFSVQDFSTMRFPQLLGRGDTNFAGSPRNRVHNIQTATERYNGVVIMPGEEFSFNQLLGAVDAENGYLPELVIKENVTTPEFGGGICQVSTTAFRASMYGGMAITARRNHSYPVKYYGAPGFDATVYTPAPDFRFKNDYAKPVYMTTRIEGSHLIFDLWGTSDGRTTKINGPFTTEKKPDGSLTTAVAQIVTRGGKVIREQNFVSKYQSPEKFPTVRSANGE